MVARAVLLVIGIVGLVAHAVAPASVTLDAGELSLFGLLIVVALAPALREFQLPGGGGGKFVEQVEEAREAIARSPEPELGLEAVDLPEAIAGQVDELALSSVQEMAAVAPAASLVALRAELASTLGDVYRHLIGGPAPTSDYELVRELTRGGIIGSDLAQAAYAVFGATEEGARERDLPIDAVKELIDIAGRILQDVAARTSPAVLFERHVGEVLGNMLPDAEVVPIRRGPGDYKVGDVVVEAKYVPPGVSAPTVIGRTIRRLRDGLEPGVRALIVVDDATDVQAFADAEPRVVRLADLTPDQLR